MNERELRGLDAWIACNVTKVSRRLTDEEYAVVVARCAEMNSEPHPDLSLTQPYRYEGTIPHYTTDPAAAMEVLKKCLKSEKGVTGLSMHGGGDGFGIIARDDVYGATLELAICRFAKKIFETK